MPPVPLNISVPNTQESSIPTSTQNTVIFGGNALGGATAANSANATPSTSTTSTDPLSSLPFSTILLYGAVALGLVFVLKLINH